MYQYFMIDINSIEKYDFYSNELININNIDIPNRYKKFIICINNSRIGCKDYDRVLLGSNHNNKMFELISNHPFNYKISNNLIVLYSATFNTYFKITQGNNNFKYMKEKDVIEFYNSMNIDNIMDKYLDLLYNIFTNAYDKSRPIISKKLSLYRDK